MTVRPFVASAVLATATSSLLTVGLAPVMGAAPGEPDQADLPRKGQVSRIYPELAGGWRAYYELGEVEMLQGNCVWWTSIATASGAGAQYFTPTTVSAQKDFPEVVVWQFPRKAGAREVMAIVKRRVNGCEGRHRDGAEVRRHNTVESPVIGSGPSFAWRETRRGVDLGQRFTVQVLHIWARVGRYVVAADVLRNDRPTWSRGLRFARLAARSVGS